MHEVRPLPVCEIMPKEPGILLPEILVYIDNGIREYVYGICCRILF